MMCFYCLFSSLCPALPQARWVIRSEGELHNLYCTVFTVIRLHTVPVLEGPTTVQSSTQSVLQSCAAGKYGFCGFMEIFQFEESAYCIHKMCLIFFLSECR